MEFQEYIISKNEFHKLVDLGLIDEISKINSYTENELIFIYQGTITECSHFQTLTKMATSLKIVTSTQIQTAKLVKAIALIDEHILSWEFFPSTNPNVGILQYKSEFYNIFAN